MSKFFSISALLMIIVSRTNSQPVNFKYDRVGSFKEGMAPVYIGKYVGYIDKTGKEVVPVIYEEDYLPDEFTDGVAIVTLNKLSGLVDKTGKLIVPCEYKGMNTFSEEIAEAYKAEGKVGFINTQGKTIIPFQYNINIMYGGAKCISGMIPVKNSTAKYGYVDKTNKLIVPFLYEVVQNFSDGLAMVKKVYNGKVSYLNTRGETVIAEKYDNGTFFKDGLAYVNIGAKEKSLYSGLDGGKWGVIDKAGKEIIPIEYDKIYEIKNGLTIVAMGKYPNEKKGLIGRDGKIILPLEYDDIKIMNGRVVANKVFAEPYALFDYAGKQITDFTWHLHDVFPDITDGLLRVQEVKNNKLGKVGAIDANGFLKIPFTYDAMNEFEEGLSTVSVNKKYGAIDKTGKIVIPLLYDGMVSFSEGWAGVYQNGKYGFINKAGKLMEFSKTTVTPTEKEPEVAETYQIKEKFFGFFLVVNGAVPYGVEGESTGGKFGILSKDDKVIIPAKYDWITIDTSNKAFFVQTGVKVFFSTKATRTEPTADVRIGILNYDGKQLYTPTLSYYSIRPNKHILVKDAITKKWGVLNSNYKSVVPFNYEMIYNFSDSGMAVKKNGKFGVINLKNETLVAFEYDTVYNGGNKAPGGYELRKSGVAIWVNAKGRIVQTVPEPTKMATGNVATSTLLLDENFDNNNNKWVEWDNEGSSAQLFKGNYRVTVKQNNNYLTWLSVPALTDQSKDFAIETKVFLNSTETGNVNDSYWLLWGLGNNGKDYYAFGIYPEGKFQYGKLVNGQWDAKAGSVSSTSINAGINKANVLRVEKRKDSIFFFINNTQVHKAKYEVFNSNHAGVGFQLNNKKLLDVDYLKIFRGAVPNVTVSPEPHESNYQKELAIANDSKSRAVALAKYLNEVFSRTDSLVFSKLLEQKLQQMAEIDFYAISEMLTTNKGPNEYKIRMQLLNVLPGDQRQIIKAYSQCIIDNYQRRQNSLPEQPYPPSHLPQPGYGLGKTVSSNKTTASVSTANKPVVPNPVQPTPAYIPAEAKALIDRSFYKDSSYTDVWGDFHSISVIYSVESINGNYANVLYFLSNNSLIKNGRLPWSVLTQYSSEYKPLEKKYGICGTCNGIGTIQSKSTSSHTNDYEYTLGVKKTYTTTTTSTIACTRCYGAGICTSDGTENEWPKPYYQKKKKY